jgi:predicted metal-dependent peptidase
MLPSTSPVYTPTLHTNKELLHRIDRAKISLMMGKGTAFFSALLSMLKLILDHTHPTGATNAISMWLNPDFCDQLDEDELIGLMLHEVMHVAADHCNFEIYKDYDQETLGIAMDHWINLTITSMGYKIPPNGYCDSKFSGWGTMKIYHELMKNPPKLPKGAKPDVLQKPSDLSDEKFKIKVESNIIKAAMQAQMAGDPGSIPTYVQIMLEDLLSPRLPWNLVLYKYMDAYAKEDYSWSRPNKRYLPDWYFPGMHSEKIEGVLAGIDVSGSMMNEIDECMAENIYIKELLAPQWFHLMTFDTQVHHDKTYEEYEDLPTKELPDGGYGGTYIEPLIERIKEMKPRFALIFTDGYFSSPNMDGVESDIFWIITKRGDQDFRPPDGIGEVIIMN